jgi:hypothetical protein
MLGQSFGAAAAEPVADELLADESLVVESLALESLVVESLAVESLADESLVVESLALEPLVDVVASEDVPVSAANATAEPVPSRAPVIASAASPLRQIFMVITSSRCLVRCT